MCPLSDRPERDSLSQAFLENSDLGEDSERKLLAKKIIDEANKISLLSIFKSSSIKIDEFSRKTTCPFPAHKGGAERSPSFVWYPDTNSFYCFGCKLSGGPVNFYSNINSIAKKDAATKILELFSNSDLIDNLKINDYNEKSKMLLDFSDQIYKFNISFIDERSSTFIDKICQTFDALNEKHELSNEALKFLISKLENHIKSYK